uniref:Ig-like domain-containing protein n=1 Tax=Seriola dumerili TaxID=41447 RepID=A0A3B4VS17_SERDU
HRVSLFLIRFQSFFIFAPLLCQTREPLGLRSELFRIKAHSCGFIFSSKLLKRKRICSEPLELFYQMIKGVEAPESQHQRFAGRVHLFVDELEQGNVSMKIFSVKLSDEGKYRCYIHSSDSVYKVTSNRTLVLQCESKGWYPEPELLWLDGEGKLLSAGRTKTVRGPDDLYTVRSRVTVEKRHSNNFTCRVQQKIINQSRETQIHVPVISLVLSTLFVKVLKHESYNHSLMLQDPPAEVIRVS